MGISRKSEIWIRHLTSEMRIDLSYIEGKGVEQDEPDGKTFTFSGSITGDGKSLKDIYYRNDGSTNVFTLRFYDGFMYASFNLSGTGTINLAQHGMNFGQLNIGTYDLGYSSQLVDTNHTLVIEYVPDAGSTAALLGVGVLALAAARRRLG